MRSRSQPGLPWTWNVLATDVALEFAADQLVGPPAVQWTRSMPVRAPVAVTHRWLCQLQMGPYSYDLIDNRGRRSPRTLTPGLGDPQLDQHLLGNPCDRCGRPGRSLTLVPHRSRSNPWFAMTYVAVPADSHASRIVCRLTVAERGRRLGACGRYALAWGDLVMIRHQLHRLARYAERT